MRATTPRRRGSTCPRPEPEGRAGRPGLSGIPTSRRTHSEGTPRTDSSSADPAVLRTTCGPVRGMTDGEPTPFDVATADATVDLATDLRKARPDPILRPRRSGGRG